MKLEQPNCCANQGSHSAKMKVWLVKNAFHDSPLTREDGCYVTEDGWQKQWRRFRWAKGIRSVSANLAHIHRR